MADEFEFCSICLDRYCDYNSSSCKHSCCKECWVTMNIYGIRNCPQCMVHVPFIISTKVPHTVIEFKEQVAIELKTESLLPTLPFIILMFLCLIIPFVILACIIKLNI